MNLLSPSNYYFPLFILYVRSKKNYTLNGLWRPAFIFTTESFFPPESSEFFRKTFLFLGIICEQFGRKVVLQWLAFLAFTTWLCISQSWNFYTVVIARIIQGFSSATLSSAGSISNNSFGRISYFHIVQYS